MTSPAILGQSLQGTFSSTLRSCLKKVHRCQIQSRLHKNAISPAVFLISAPIARDFEVLECNPIKKFHDLLTDSSQSSVLVINSISFLFQSPDISLFRRGAYLDYMKSSFARLCASDALTVRPCPSLHALKKNLHQISQNEYCLQIITSSQLSTKMVNADGTRGSFDSGGRGIVLPQLGRIWIFPLVVPFSSQTCRSIISSAH
jgi:hypothetical protein